MSLEIANTIKNQLGHKALYMMGAKNLATVTASENVLGGLTFKIRGSKFCNYIKITLNGLDLYDIEFIKIWGTKYSVPCRIENVYCDMMHKIIEDKTKLYLSL